MKQYIAIDSGKSKTKVAYFDMSLYQKNKDNPIAAIKKDSFLTRIGEGSFEDDDPGSNTSIVEYDGKVYKIGKSAERHAELTTSKKTEVHKLCTLYAIARICSETEVDEVYATIGVPVKDYEFYESRNEYRNYILPEGEITIRYKTSGESPVVTKTFKIVSRRVLPESLGAVLQKGVNPNGTVAVVDIGHLNVNQTIYNNGEPDKEYSVTTTYGGNSLVTGLAQKLSANFSFINPKQVAVITRKKGSDRCLKPNVSNPEVEKASKELIDEYMLNHVKKIKDDCAAAQWSIDYLTFVFIGGGAETLSNEIKTVFGEHVIIPPNPEFSNAIGFLMIMTAKILKINWGVVLTRRE